MHQAGLAECHDRRFRALSGESVFSKALGKLTETPLTPENEFAFDLARLEIPTGTTLVAIVTPNDPNGGTFDMTPLPDLLRKYSDTHFLVDEAFIGLAGQSVAHLVPIYSNLLVTRTLSKAHSLAEFRVGYAVLPEQPADALNTHNDAYPLARPSQAAALATFQYEGKIRERVRRLRQWTEELAAGLRALGVRTFATCTYFFLADASPRDATDLASRPRERQILIKPLQNRRLGPGYLRVTTALPKENAQFTEALRTLLPTASIPSGPGASV